MILKNSIKQLFRTPIRTLAMFLLVMVSTALFILELLLFWWNQRDTVEFEDSFTTIGTVEQIPDSVEEQAMWNNSKDSYSYSLQKKYQKWIKDSVLDFDGANYLLEPKKRPYFISVYPGLAEKVWEQWGGHSTSTVAEIVPNETKPVDSIQVHVTKVLSGNVELEGYDIYISDPFNREPDTMEAGKTYIVQLGGMDLYEGAQEALESGTLYPETAPMWMEEIGSSQYTIDDEPIGKEAGTILFDEVTDGFYETERGKIWRYLSEHDRTKDAFSSLQVRPVENTNQLMAFHTKKAAIIDGHDFSEAEYKTGADVCLISAQFAELMGMKVGDTISLPLLYALYGAAPSQNFAADGSGFVPSELNADFEPYQIFDNDKYKIVGIYEMKALEDSAFGLAPYEVIVPYSSVTGDWSNNIITDGPMSIGTTVFQIPNGTIDQFKKAWEKQGIDGLKITFYDGGYSSFQNAIKDRKMMSYILLLGGGIATLVILALFGHLQIIRQRNRIFIERALGMSKNKCRKSILSGMYLIMAGGVAAGGILSFLLTDSVMERAESKSMFDTTFSSGMAEVAAFASPLSASQKGRCILAGCLIVAAGAFLMHNLYVNQVLKGEPVELMEKEE
ncbi:MAG: hypothetical protein PHQ72_06795 [Hespellia sp.]|nr:hypothetical protein [Hespellia sp.]